MSPKNPIFDDNVNVSKTHPLIDFFWLAGAAILLVVTLTVFFYISMQWIAPWVPFSFEQKLVSNIDFAEFEDSSNDPDPQREQRLNYLQSLADALSVAQGLPEDMPITVHWMDDDMVNAFASLGGHIVITKGLWDAMPSENALAMVMAHEIAHVKHRDPLKGLGAGVALSLLTAVIFGASDSGLSLVGSGGLITSLHFSRAMEASADEAALGTLHKHYGHVAGSTDFFASILRDEFIDIAFLQTHPLTQDRIDSIVKIQKENGWPDNLELVIQLPEKFSNP